jgi:hypothetical protein
VPTDHHCRAVDATVVWDVSPTFAVVATRQAVELHGDLHAADVGQLVRLLHTASWVHGELRRGVGIAALMRRLAS